MRRGGRAFGIVLVGMKQSWRVCQRGRRGGRIRLRCASRRLCQRRQRSGLLCFGDLGEASLYVFTFLFLCDSNFKFCHVLTIICEGHVIVGVHHSSSTKAAYCLNRLRPCTSIALYCIVQYMQNTYPDRYSVQWWLLCGWLVGVHAGQGQLQVEFDVKHQPWSSGQLLACSPCP